MLLLGYTYKKGCKRNIILYSYLVGLVVFNILGLPFLLAGSDNPYGRDYSEQAYLVMIPMAQLLIGLLILHVQPRTGAIIETVSRSGGISCVPELSLIVGLLIYFYMLATQGLPPIFSTDFELSNQEMVSGRSDYLENLGSAWFFRIGIYHLPLLGLLTAIQDYYGHRRSKLLFFRCVVYFFLAVLLSLSLLHKTPVINVFITTIIMFAIFRNEGSISRAWLTKLGIATFVLIVGIYSVFYGQPESFEVFQGRVIGIINRVIGAYLYSLAELESVIAEYGNGYGTSIINPAGLFSYEVFPLSSVIHQRIFGFEGNAPPPAIGYIYFDFGLIGAVFAIFMIPLFLTGLYFLTSKADRAFRLWATVYCCNAAFMLGTQSFFELFINPAVFITFAAVYIVSALGVRLVVRPRRVNVVARACV